MCVEMELIRDFLANKKRNHLFGATSEARELIQIFSELNINVAAVIDNFYPHREFNGLPCIRLEDADKDSIVLSSVTNSRPIDVRKLVIDKGYKHVDYFSFYRLSGIKCPAIAFWDGAGKHWEENESKYAEVRQLFSDEQSISTFDAVTAFRNTYDLAYMEQFKFDISNMYMESFVLPFDAGDVFFDLGAFDGSDTMRFLRYCKSGLSFMFEPIPKQVNCLKNITANNSRISVVAAAVGKDCRKVKFNVSGTSSKVSSEVALDECIEVSQISLDEFVMSRGVIPNFIKMDVEGAESDVVSGMRTLIREHKPKLAISVYHKVEDIIDIPLTLKQINSEYKFYLRHYTQGYSETVLFAV